MTDRISPQNPTAGQPQAEQCDQGRADLRLEPGAGDPVHDGDLVRRILAIEVADEDRGAEPQDGDAGQQEHQPALQVHAGIEPARQAWALHRSSSRWKTVTVAPDISASRLRSSSASAIDR